MGDWAVSLQKGVAPPRPSDILVNASSLLSFAAMYAHRTPQQRLTVSTTMNGSIGTSSEHAC